MNQDWAAVVVVDPLELQRLKDDCTRLRVACRWRTASAWGVLVASVGFAAVAGSQRWHAPTLSRDLGDGRRSAQRSSRALAAMARSHERILSATEQTPLLGTKSWGRRFTVTSYIPRSPKYGKFNDGLTATLTKAEPSARIVAVDPALIPYGSGVWIEGLGWYRAGGRGGAIQGVRLDLPVPTDKEAGQFGKQVRFVIVVPPGVKPASDLAAAGPGPLRVARGGAKRDSKPRKASRARGERAARIAGAERDQPWPTPRACRRCTMTKGRPRRRSTESRPRASSRVDNDDSGHGGMTSTRRKSTHDETRDGERPRRRRTRAGGHHHPRRSSATRPGRSRRALARPSVRVLCERRRGRARPRSPL